MSASETGPSFVRPNARELMERLKPITAELEADRQQAIAKRKRAMLVAACIAVATLLITIALLSTSEQEPLPGLLCAGGGTLIAFVAFVIIGGKAKEKYLARFKWRLFAEAVSITFPGMKYSPDSMIPESVFEDGDLFDSRVDRYHGEDAFRGRIGSTELLFSELHVERKETSTNSKGHSRTKWVTVFKGIYMIADFHKEFSCQVKIVPDFAEANFGWLGRKFQGITGGLMRLENPDFERAFKVTSTDEIAARYILTPDMQERFLALRDRWSSDLRAALLNSNLHLAIPKTTDWFEPDFNRPADDLAALHTFLTRLTMLLQIPEALDLNTRIWTKE